MPPVRTRLTAAPTPSSPTLGRCSEAERDRIEQRVGEGVRACAAAVDALERNAAPPGSDATLAAHRHGVVSGIEGGGEGGGGGWK